MTLDGGKLSTTRTRWKYLYLLRRIHTYHAVPLPWRSAKGLYCDFPIWFTQCGRVWFTHTMPFPCHGTNMPFTACSWHGRGRVTACEQRGNGMLATCQLSASFCYHAGVPRKFVIWSMPISDAGGQCETKQRLSWTRRSVLFWCNGMCACIIYGTTIMITI
jgi:hypothetical protein